MKRYDTITKADLLNALRDASDDCLIVICLTSNTCYQAGVAHEFTEWNIGQIDRYPRQGGYKEILLHAADRRTL